MNSRLSYGRFAKMAEPLTRRFRRKDAADKESAGFDLKRLLRIAPRQVLGLDVGSSAVKIVQLRKKDNSFAVTAAAIVEIDRTEKTPQDDGEDADTVSAITKCLKSTQSQTRFAVCGVCGPEVAVRYFDFPSLLPAEVEGAVLLEASQVCPFNVDDGAVDYQLIPDGDSNMRGVFVAATNKLTEGKSRLVFSTSEVPTRISPSSARMGCHLYATLLMQAMTSSMRYQAKLVLRRMPFAKHLPGTTIRTRTNYKSTMPWPGPVRN
jgi:hypothetical protein